MAIWLVKKDYDLEEVIFFKNTFVPKCLLNYDHSLIFLRIFPISPPRDLNYNNLGEFPQAIKALPSLKEL